MKELDKIDLGNLGSTTVFSILQALLLLDN